jgi:hypothetical protein
MLDATLARDPTGKPGDSPQALLIERKLLAAVKASSKATPRTTISTTLGRVKPITGKIRAAAVCVDSEKPPTVHAELAEHVHSGQPDRRRRPVRVRRSRSARRSCTGQDGRHVVGSDMQPGNQLGVLLDVQGARQETQPAGIRRPELLLVCVDRLEHPAAQARA